MYSVPDECVFRLASSPLQHVRRLEDGTLASSIHVGVPSSVIRTSELWKVSPSDTVRVRVVVRGCVWLCVVVSCWVWLCVYGDVWLCGCVFGCARLCLAAFGCV